MYPKLDKKKEKVKKKLTSNDTQTENYLIRIKNIFSNTGN